MAMQLSGKSGGNGMMKLIKKKSSKLGRLVVTKQQALRTKRSSSVSSGSTETTDEEGQMSLSMSTCSCCSQSEKEEKKATDEEDEDEDEYVEEEGEEDCDDEDAFGAADDSSFCRVEETPELLEECLEELEVELGKIDDRLKVSYRMALEKCPSLVNREHKLLFLRCEEYFVELAALRLVRYWDKRRALFGDDRAFAPIGTPEDTASLRDDYGALEVGMIQMTRQTDDRGRVVFYEDPSRLYQLDRKKEAAGVCATLAARRAARCVHRCSLARSMWYIVHEALLDPELGESLQRNGMVLIIRKDGMRHSLMKTISCFDRRTFLMIFESLFGCLPVRVEAFHICRPPVLSALMAIPMMHMHAPLIRANMYVHQCGGKIDKTCHWRFEPDEKGKYHCQSQEHCLRPSTFKDDDEFRWKCNKRSRSKRRPRLDSHKKWIQLARQRDIALIQLLEQVGGLPKTSIPIELGGSLRLNHNAWLVERCRLATEAAAVKAVEESIEA